MSDNNNEQNGDDLLKRIKRLGIQTKKRKNVPVEDSDFSVAELQRDLSLVAKTILHIKDGFLWIAPKIIRPLIRILPFLKNIWQFYKRLWRWFCYPERKLYKEIYFQVSNFFKTFGQKSPEVTDSINTDDEAESEKELARFSRGRAGVFICLTFLVFAWPLRVPYLKDISYATCYEPVYDSVRIAANMLLHGGKIRVETVYLNGKNELSAEDNYWSINGCEDKVECPPEDAVYFRVKPSLVHFIWSIVTKGLPFIADDVAGVVPNVPSQCRVKSYGSRWRLMKWMQSYPIALDVKCEMLKR